ncbi:hypothetical protein BDV38DRAFT_269677 [Aspergillus pseudotamarii]|uniref:FluG domain-containing protein n=1 Tax=Aspergillus pseudotamarii TaxID=132259 RepID=A0A5N6T114_ASPPS|nr:uncharacterized protein BDV38DRAFT_269677 [Aspergillus pseudotamarii]KAE8139909.1 hypothetical protein BDV38DRAFT_269677 [Aspergillus pseudotamarii]
MTYSGLPRRKYASHKDSHGHKSYLYYAQRRKLHLENGPTLTKYSPNTNISAASVRGKWARFCSEVHLDPDDLLERMTSADVNSWFDWIERNFKGSIKAHSALANYWRTLKRLYFLKNHREMDADMKRDCINYMNVISSNMGLRRHPLPKQTAASDDLLQFLVSHLVHCDSVFADEKQRLYPLVGLNLSSITACRAVSLFDTRHPVQLQADGSPILTAGGVSDDANRSLTLSPPPSKEVPPDSGHDSGIQSDDDKRGCATSDDSAYTDSEIDTMSDGGDLSDCSSVTDDGYLNGDETTGTILWRHVEFYVVRNLVPERRHILAAIVTLLHTKGEDRKPRLKRFVIEHEDNLIFDLLSQLLALALHDDIFAATIKDVSHIYTAPIPDHRKGIQLKIKRETLDIPVFREPEHTPEGYRTSDLRPLKSRTWSRIIKRIGVRSGQRHNLTQKVLRRGGRNAINNTAPSSVRDQVADHESNAVKYYLNEIVDFDTAAAFHKRPSNEVVQRELRSATLLADNTAPIGLTDAQAQRISRNPEVRRLRRVCRALTAEVYNQGYKTLKEAAGTEIGERKKQADAELSSMLTRLREEAKEKNRQRHFRRTDTAIFNQQYERNEHFNKNKAQPRLTQTYQIAERNELVGLLCYSTPPEKDVDAHLRRLKFIRLLVRWQNRKESPRRGRQTMSITMPQPTDLSLTAGTSSDRYDPLQCPFCLSDTRLPLADRERRKSKINKLWDHVENIHGQELAAFDSGFRRCGLCGMRNIDFIPSSVPNFKNHTQTVHGIRLGP